jgi:hypothetical protein
MLFDQKIALFVFSPKHRKSLPKGQITNWICNIIHALHSCILTGHYFDESLFILRSLRGI